MSDMWESDPFCDNRPGWQKTDERRIFPILQSAVQIN